MGIWKSLFGKKPPRASGPPPADDEPGPAELLSGLDDDGAQRSLSAKVADMYVELVRTTMFNSR